MYRFVTITFAFSLFLTISPVLAQQGATFESLGVLPGGIGSQAEGVSHDGLVVAGYSSFGDGNNEPFRWENGKLEGLGHLEGGPFFTETKAISADGSAVVGMSDSSNGLVAFRWTVDNGMEGLGSLSGGSFFSFAYDVSGNGSVVVGVSTNADGNQEAFRWENGIMEGLGDLPGDTFWSEAHAVSADGSIVAGFSMSSFGTAEAFRWQDGIMESLADPSSGFIGSSAYGISADGSVIVGIGPTTDGFQEAFRWTEENGMERLGHLDGGFYSHARATSADGSVIVGLTMPGVFGFEAFIWTEEEGMRSLKEVLENDYGLDLSGWTLEFANSISDDGRIIVGSGVTSNGTEAWRVVLPASGESGPENDHISDATVIPAANATYEGTNVDATLEDGEPEPSCTFGAWTTNFSVWWTFTADAESNRVTINTFGSDFDTILSLHGADDLSEVACDDDTDGLQSQIEDASIVAGETYLIRVAGYDQSGANQGDIQLTTAFHWVSGEDSPNEIVQGLTHPSPNPVRETASFTLAVDRGQQVTVEVFDVMGRRVQTLYEGSLAAGAMETLRLDANALSSGVYVIRALGEDFVDTSRVTVVR